MNNPVRALAALMLAVCLSVAGADADASVRIAGTRVVFPARGGEVTVRLSNENATPALVEAWIDRGDEHSTPDKVDTPFLITPPLFRMEPHRDQSLRIIFTHESLPADRESLFWLNVLEVPPRPSGKDADGRNYLQLAIRSRLKLFYRPDGLAGNPLEAPAALSFRVAVDGTATALVVHNPTPYHVTLAELAVDAGGTPRTADTGMVAPQSDLRLLLHGHGPVPATGATVSFSAINDYGANTPFTATVTP